MMQLPLKGLLVLEFSQYLSGPSAGLRLADLGARVIKIERPKTGDACRKLSIKNLWADENNSLLFHTINRNKESFTANLKDPQDLKLVLKLIAKADVVTHNFRPGIMEKTGLGYGDVIKINPKLIYAEISGYGKKGPWKNKPGQDLLLQAMTGLAYTTGNANDAPMPFGLSIADYMAGGQLVQGILAALIRRQKTGKGALIEISLMESLLDFQFELLTTYYSSGKGLNRSQVSNGNPLLGAPYGIYQTATGYIAIAMMDIQVLATVIGSKQLEQFSQSDTFVKRDEIKRLLGNHLLQASSIHWLEMLQHHGLWAMEVNDWHEMTQKEAYQVLQMEQTLQVNNKSFTTTRCPIRIDGKRIFSSKPAPELGEHQLQIQRDLINQ
ncbi:MAG: carnitine dehydratase [Chitinophagaceae bacterium BSSC1]|nr:MAG: carnitine dehydratase [Chitinophagaceae bacterium BSSC1]